jgi:hypothetical protein
MALLNCPECNSEISEKAKLCPKCGMQLLKPSRTIFGKIVKWLFIGFNIYMLFAFVKGVGNASQGIENATSEAAKAGATIGTGLGAMMLIFVWAAGSFILGLFTLFTRPK